MTALAMAFGTINSHAPNHAACRRMPRPIPMALGKIQGRAVNARETAASKLKGDEVSRRLLRSVASAK